MRIYLFLGIYFFSIFQIFSQEISAFKVSAIDSVLKIDVNSIVRLHTMEVNIDNSSKMSIKNRLVITVLNRKAEQNLWFGQQYSSSRKLKKIEALIYDKNGIKINKIKENEFVDRSITDYATVASDSRKKYLHYVGNTFPYTIDFNYEIETTNTGFMPVFYFNGRYNQSVEQAEYKIFNPTRIPLRYKEVNFLDLNIKKEESDEGIVFKAADLKPVKKEVYGPSYNKIFPYVKVSLEDFTLVNIAGKVTNWKEMGGWQNENLLKNRRDLSDEVINEITKLVEGETDQIEKAKKIYNYVQNKTRYVGIQLGIGGWKPMKASDVDTYGYGDCKALTNYTKALLDSQNIPAYYSVIYGNEEIINIDEDFVSLEGNHVILNLPNKGNDLWLECTSQTVPFGYIGGFTDNRNALVITPEGGQIKKTTHYKTEQNILETTINLKFNIDNSVSGTFESKAAGIQYNWQSKVKFAKNKIKHYTESEFYHLNNLNIQNVNLIDDKDTIQYKETFDFSITSFGNKAGSRLIFKPNFFNVYNPSISSKERNFDLVISHGFVDVDNYVYEFPPEYELYKLPKSNELKTEFGAYSFIVKKIDDHKIKLTRKLIINEGKFNKEKYEDYKEFVKKIKSYDNSKAILSKI